MAMEIMIARIISVLIAQLRSYKTNVRTLMRQDLTLDNLSICVSIFIKELSNVSMRTIVTVLFNVICKLDFIRN